MRLYPKRLRNIEDLEKEKQLLLKKSRLLEKEDILSVEGLLGKKNGGGKESGKGGSLLDFIPVSNPLVGLLVKMIGRRLSKKENPPKAANAPPVAERKAAKNKLKAIAIEFIGGYLKWKAIELSIKGIRHIIKARGEKKETAEQTSPGLSEREMKKRMRARS